MDEVPDKMLGIRLEERMDTKEKATVYVVYGNHGPSPAQLDDYLSYLSQAFRAVGYEVTFCEDPMPGKLNVLIECFDQEFCYKIKKASATPGTQFYVMATEFITGQTFNDFSSDIA